MEAERCPLHERVCGEVAAVFNNFERLRMHALIFLRAILD